MLFCIYCWLYAGSCSTISIWNLLRFAGQLVSNLTDINVSYTCFITREQVFVSKICFSALCQKFSQLKLNMWKIGLRRSLLVKLIHCRYILTSKTKVVFFSLRLYTYSNLLLLSDTYSDSFVSGCRRLILGPCTIYLGQASLFEKSQDFFF